MTLAHVHLLSNHIPILGVAFGILVLLHAATRKSPPIRSTALLLFIFSALGCAVAYWTGESAEEAVEHLAGVTHDSIEAHEDSAIYSLVSILILGTLSIVAYVLSGVKAGFDRVMTWLVLCAALFSFTISARTGYLGGLIRHSELNGSPAPAGAPAEHDD